MAEKKNKQPEEKEEWTKETIIHELLSMILYLIVVFGVCFFILNFVGQRTRVIGSSMESTLSDGDNLIVDKITYRFHDPERFDIIIFPFQYEEDTNYIKRIIGMPGETVWINNSGEIYIDGVLLSENYGLETIAYAGLASTPITLADDEYFVLGDNRNNSTDSRFDVVGPIHREDIIGRAWVRIYPLDKMCVIKHQ